MEDWVGKEEGGGERRQIDERRIGGGVGKKKRQRKGEGWDGIGDHRNEIHYYKYSPIHR